MNNGEMIKAFERLLTNINLEDYKEEVALLGKLKGTERLKDDDGNFLYDKRTDELFKEI